MIAQFIATKWRKDQTYRAIPGMWVYSGHTTTTASIPNIPRLPMFPDMAIERTWIEYFRKMHKLLEDHMEDYQVHKVK